MSEEFFEPHQKYNLLTKYKRESTDDGLENGHYYEYEDYIQEISRSSFADMLHDYERNDKYYDGIKAAIEQKHKEGKKAHVLDIGTGTGLLAMMAARCGADTIHACEAFLPISKCAEEVIRKNRLADRITVIHKQSTYMTVRGPDHPNGDLPQKCNILVTELFDTELIGEGAIESFNHALTHLLEEGCLVVPRSATVYACVVESEWMQRWNKLSPWGDLVPSKAIEQCSGAAAVHDLQLSQVRSEDFKLITAPVPVFRFDWTGGSWDRSPGSLPIPPNDRSLVDITAEQSGTAQMVFMWWSLDMDPEGKIELSCAPWWAHPLHPPNPDAIPWRDHWMQAVYYLPKPLQVTEGQHLQLLASHDEVSLWFNLSSSVRDDPKDFSRSEKTESDVDWKRPVCDCMLHVTCSRTRIGMLNDPVRRDKYLTVMRRLVKPDSVVLSVGENSLLGLQAALLGAKHVYHLEERQFSYNVMADLIKDNNLSSQVTLVKLQSAALDQEIADSVNLIVREPFSVREPFTDALFPLPLRSWWSLRRQCSRAGMVCIPEAVTMYAMPMQFDHLHKIQAPLSEISGFKMTPFDNLIKVSRDKSDSVIEVHPLWEYRGISLAEPLKITNLEFKEYKGRCARIIAPFTASGTWNAVVLWVDLHLDLDTTVSTGPREPVVPGAPVHWDPYTRQAVYFLPEPLRDITTKNYFNCGVDISHDEEFSFRFRVSETGKD